jgi:hypothetical protein
MPDDDDDRIDALVRAASTRPVDEGRLTQTVLTRIRMAGAPSTAHWTRLFALPQFAGPGRLAPAGFVLVLIATPFAVANYPGDPADQVIYALALGDPALLAAPDTFTFVQGLDE